MCNAASDTGNSHQCCVDQALNNAGADRDSHDNGFHQDQKIRKQIDALNNTTSNEATALMQAEDLLRFTEKSPIWNPSTTSFLHDSLSVSSSAHGTRQYSSSNAGSRSRKGCENHGLFLLQDWQNGRNIRGAAQLSEKEGSSDRPSLYLCQNAAIFIGLVCIIQTGIHTILYPLKANISNALSKFSSFTRM